MLVQSVIITHCLLMRRENNSVAKKKTSTLKLGFHFNDPTQD